MTSYQRDQSIDVSQLTFNLTDEEMEKFGINDFFEDFVQKERMFGRITEYVLIGVYILLMILGIFSNSSIILVIVLNKKLKTSNNILLLNLFLSDLLLCVFCMPFTLLALIHRSWHFGKIMCKLIPFIQAVSIFVSAGTITSIAIDRMTMITSNRIPKVQSRVRRECVKYFFNAFVIWFVAVVLASPIFFYQDIVEQGIKGVLTYEKCLEDWPRIYKSIYSFIILLVQLLIPNSVMVFSHFRIKHHLNINLFIREKPSIDSSQTKTSQTVVQSNESEGIVVEEVVVASPSLAINGKETIATNNQQTYDYRRYRKEVRRNNRITLFLITITIMFGISWLPWNAFNVLVDFIPEIDLSAKTLYLILAICHLVAMSSATTNAIFYGFLHTSIRIEIIDKLKKLKNFFC